jgi:glycosyltransferase involved in cell wall biosynthesis
MKRILFISHDASRTGAPTVLLNFLEWLKKQEKCELTIYIKHGGELEERFKKLATTYLPVQKTLSQRIVKRVLNTVKENDITLPPQLLKKTFDLVYLNTVVCLDLAPVIKANFKCPVICHVHENDFTIKYYYPAFVTDNNLGAVDHFIAVSQSTQKNLIDNYAVPPKKITNIYEFISLNAIKKPSISISAAKEELGLGNEFIIGGSGLTIWRKGVDLFMQLAVVLARIRPDSNIKLVWVGALTHEFACQYAYEAKLLGIADKIVFTGTKVSPQNYFQLFDVFALTSREDPFPLVAIEAASLNKPIVCFENSGGMPEFIKDGDNGLVVSYGDINQFAIQLLTLMDDENLRLKMGKQAGKLIADFDVNIAAPKIMQLIEQLMEAKSA